MTVYGGSHTNFDAGQIGADAMAGAVTIASAMVAGLQRAAAINEIDWSDWTQEQLSIGLGLSEGLRRNAVDRAEAAEREAAGLRLVVARLTAERRGQRG